MEQGIVDTLCFGLKCGKDFRMYSVDRSFGWIIRRKVNLSTDRSSLS